MTSNDARLPNLEETPVTEDMVTDQFLPDKWSDWRLEEIIGEHGPVTVYKAVREDEAGISYSAIKIIRIPESEETAQYTDEIGMMLSVKGHPNFVTIEDYATEHRDGFLFTFIRMELLTPLDQYIAANDFDEHDMIHLGIEICNALEVCQQKKILHLDVKPSNIFVSNEGHYKLGDFGISRYYDDLEGRPFNYYSPNFMGAELYHYMKREGMSAKDKPVPLKLIGSKYDQCSLGLVLYWIKNGCKAPFVPDKVLTPEDRKKAFRRRMAGEALPQLDHISEDLAGIIFKASAYHPADRYSNPAKMRKALEKLEKNPKSAGLKKRTVVGLASIMVCIALISCYFAFCKKSDASGSCGEKLNWQIKGSVLWISGRGEMYDYNPTTYTAPWEEYKDRISKIVVREGTTKIGRYAFFQSGQLTEVELPHSLRRINNMAFGYCYKLPLLAIPEGVEYIEESIIYRCPMLARVELPGSIKTIEGSFAGECENLATITLGKNCTAYTIRDGVLFDYEMKELLCHPAGLDDLSYSIPETVRTIGVYAFAENRNLQEVFIPDGLVTIDGCAFTGCSNLETMTIPESVTTLGIYAFYDCEKLQGIQLPPKIRAIDQQAFYNCFSLQEVIIPSGVTRIGTAVFSNCTSLERIVIPVSVTNISQSAFDGSPKVVICGESGSYAEQFAAEHDIAFSADVT